MNRLNWGKASGFCGIHAELLKAGGYAALVSLYAVLCPAWNTGIIPTDWKRGLVVPLTKGKGDRQDCSNYRGVTLLSVLGKVFAQIIIDSVCCEAFDSVNRDALWRILHLRGVPPKRMNLMSELYSGTEGVVSCGDVISDLFPVVTGVC